MTRTRRQRRRRPTASLLLAAMFLPNACGLSGQAEAELIAAENVDYELLGTTTSTTSTTVVAQPIFAVSYYWHTAGDNSLRQVVRGTDTQPEPGATLTALVLGPTAADLEDDPELQSRVDESMEPQLIGPNENGEVTIRIQRPAEEQLTTDQAAEFVCTVTQFGSITSVTIVDPEDTPFSLSGLGAVPIQGPARPSDFGDCIETPVPQDDEETTETTEAGEGSTTTG